MRKYRIEYVMGFDQEVRTTYVKAYNKEDAHIIARDFIETFEEEEPELLYVAGFRTNNGKFHDFPRFHWEDLGCKFE